jgi:hypothetical protein
MNLTEALAALPGTASGIAKHFREAGIRGVPADAYCCAVANWLVAQGFTAATVGDHRIEVTDDDSGFEEADTPKPVAEFLRQFDSYAWPDLVAAGGDVR